MTGLGVDFRDSIAQVGAPSLPLNDLCAPLSFIESFFNVAISYVAWSGSPLKTTTSTQPLSINSGHYHKAELLIVQIVKQIINANCGLDY